MSLSGSCGAPSHCSSTRARSRGAWPSWRPTSKPLVVRLLRRTCRAGRALPRRLLTQLRSRAAVAGERRVVTSVSYPLTVPRQFDIYASCGCNLEHKRPEFLSAMLFLRLVWPHLQREEMSFINEVYNNPLEPPQSKARARAHFRLIEMPCCAQVLCWVNPRLPNHCPNAAYSG